MVVKISYGAFDALVGGDLTGETPNEEAVIASTVGEIELYKVHHHGSRYSSNAAFLATLLPTVSFISVGRDNTYGHPTPECLSRLANVGSDVWQTEDPSLNRINGHIQLTSATGSSFTVAQGSQLRHLYVQGRYPGHRGAHRAGLAGGERRLAPRRSIWTGAPPPTTWA